MRKWATPPDRRVTEQRLLDWALEVGTSTLLSGSSLASLQLVPGSEATLVSQMHTELRQNLLGSHEFTGTATARQAAADRLSLDWDRVGPTLSSRLSTWYREQWMAAVERTPSGSELVTQAATYADLMAGNYRTPARFYRALGTEFIVWPGQRWGSRVIVGTLGSNGIWYHLVDHPYFFYDTSHGAFNDWDPVLTEVSRQVAERSRFAAGVLPVLVQAAGFTLGLSTRIGFVLAGIALEELGEEMQRDANGQKRRSWSEILTSAGKSLLIDRALNRVFGGSGGSLDGTAAKAAATAEERAAVVAIEARAEKAIRGEIVETDAPEVAAALRAGKREPVRDPELLEQGYIAEVKIASEGQQHVYRQLENGTWCRFSKRICGLELGDEVDDAAKSAAEIQLQRSRGQFDQLVHENAVLTLVHERLRKGATSGRARIDLGKLTPAEREVLDDVSPTGNAADLTLGELARLRKPAIAERASQLDNLLREEAALLERLRDEARPLYDKMRAASPRLAERRKVLSESRGLDAASRGSPRTELAVDHVVPVREIVDMKDFRDLPWDDQLAVVNDLKNLRAIDAAANSSRGDRSWASWPQARQHYQQAAINRMIALEDQLRGYIQREIKRRLARARRATNPGGR